MKKAKKEYLKSLKISGFKWNIDPIELYKSCQDGEGDIEISKKDLKKLFDVVMKREYIKDQIISNLGHQLGY